MEKILSIVWYKVLPPVFGGQKGIASFNKNLAIHYELDCLCSKNNKLTGSEGYTLLPELPTSKTQFFNPFVWRKVIQLCKKNKYSHLILEFPYYGLLGIWLKKKGTKLIIHTHNIERERFKELGKWWWRFLGMYEQYCLRRADLVLFKTEADKQYAVKHYSVDEMKCHIVPFGIDEIPVINKTAAKKILQQRHSIAATDKILLFAGTLDYLPNAEAVEYIYQSLDPELRQALSQRYKIIICGRLKNPSFQYLQKFESENVIFAGEVNDIGTYFCGADVFINPVQKAGGVQTKLIDAVSYNLNVITILSATNGLPGYLLNKKVFTVANNNPAEFVQKINETFFHHEDTPGQFYNEFNWANILTGLCEKINENVSNRQQI